MVLAAGQAAGFLIGMAGSAFLARMLGPEGRGTFELLVLFPNLAVLLLRGGLATGAVFHAGADDAARVRLGANALGLTILVGLTGGVAGAALAGTLPSIPVPRALLVAAFAVFPCFLWISNARELLNGLSRFRANAISIVSERASLTFALGVAFAIGGHALPTLFAIYLAGIAAIAGLLAFQLRLRPRFALGEEAGRIVRYGLKSSPAPILLFLHMRLDQMVLGWSGATTALGLYVIAMTVSEVFLPIPDAITSALYPRLTRAGADRSEIAARAARISHACLLVLAACVLAAARPAVAILFGDAFLPALAFVPMLVAARVTLSGSAILRAVLLADGRPFQVSAISGIGLAVNVTGLVMLVPDHGALGAAGAAMISAITEYALTLAMTARALARSPLALVIPRGADIASLRATAVPRSAPPAVP